MSKTAQSVDELLDVLRARREECGISFETLDHIAGTQSGYSAKILSPNPSKGLGEMSLAAILGALAMGIVRIELAVDPAQVERIRHRWKTRERPLRANARTGKPKWLFSRTKAREAGIRRWAGISPAARARLARKAARARWRKAKQPPAATHAQ